MVRTYTLSGLVRACVLTLLAASILAVAGAYLYLRFGSPPVAVADKPFPDEEQIVHIPLDARIDRQLEQPPFAGTPDSLKQGATVYMSHCAVCHGAPGNDSLLAKAMYPSVPQLWARHPGGVVGVSDDPVGVTYWKVQNGIRLTGMPAFQHMLSTDQMWQVSLLMAKADQPLSPEVVEILNGPVRSVFDERRPHP